MRFIWIGKEFYEKGDLWWWWKQKIFHEQGKAWDSKEVGFGFPNDWIIIAILSTQNAVNKVTSHSFNSSCNPLFQSTVKENDDIAKE